jgi:hypothetical protein
MSTPSKSSSGVPQAGPSQAGSSQAGSSSTQSGKNHTPVLAGQDSSYQIGDSPDFPSTEAPVDRGLIRERDGIADEAPAPATKRPRKRPTTREAPFSHMALDQMAAQGMFNFPSDEVEEVHQRINLADYDKGNLIAAFQSHGYRVPRGEEHPCQYMRGILLQRHSDVYSYQGGNYSKVVGPRKQNRGIILPPHN